MVTFQMHVMSLLGVNRNADHNGRLYTAMPGENEHVKQREPIGHMATGERP